MLKFVLLSRGITIITIARYIGIYTLIFISNVIHANAKVSVYDTVTDLWKLFQNTFLM